MKNLILFIVISSSSAFAGNLHLKKDETIKVTVEGCRLSEYASVASNGVYIKGKCLPKTCFVQGRRITLKPEEKIIATESSHRAAKILAKLLVKEDVCQKIEYYTPSM